MPKKYPWQRWPEKKKGKAKNHQDRGQNQDSSWKNSSLDDLQESDAERYAAQKGYQVKTMSHRTLKDYAGMNYYAAKKLGFMPLPKKDEVWVSDNLSYSDRETTIRHEAIEAEKMKGGDTSYWEAHTIAYSREKT